MNTKRTVLLSAGLGLASLVAAGVAFVVFQICFVESFWLHAMVFPLNPRTLAQPIALSHIGALCQILFPLLFLLGVGLFGSSAWVALRRPVRNA